MLVYVSCTVLISDVPTVVVIVTDVTSLLIPKVASAEESTYLPSFEVKVIIPSVIVPWIPLSPKAANNSAKVVFCVLEIVTVAMPVPFCMIVNVCVPVKVVNSPIVLSICAVFVIVVFSCTPVIVTGTVVAWLTIVPTTD